MLDADGILKRYSPRLCCDVRSFPAPVAVVIVQDGI